MKKEKVYGPLILALETATDIGSVAVFSGPSLLGAIDIRKEKSHAKLLTPMVKGLLEKLEIPPTDLKAVAVGKGPGSYTGLRVGVSTAKGLCLALGIPLFSISSLELLAWKVQDVARNLEALICPMIDARRMEVYLGIWNHEMKPVREIEAVIVDSQSILAELGKQKVIFLGDGAKKCEAVLGGHPNAFFLSQYLSSAADMGPAIWHKYQQNKPEDLTLFEPYYLKDFVATQAKDRLKETRK